MTNNPQFLTASDVAKILGVSRSKAYQICKQLSDELRKNGYIAISGRVSTKYFNERMYGGITNVSPER